MMCIIIIIINGRDNDDTTGQGEVCRQSARDERPFALLNERESTTTTQPGDVRTDGG
jgi:hypothetical protein